MLWLVVICHHQQQAATPNITVNQTTDDCSAQSTTLRVVVLFDITPEYATNFRNQQHRLFKTLRHIDQQVKGHQRFYALVAFHRTSVVLSGLNYAQAKNVEKIIAQISGLNPRRRLETAPSKAFATAAELLEYHQESNTTSETTNIVLLIHDGFNTDMRNETFEAISKLTKHGAEIYAITGNLRPNEEILTEYTGGQRSHVFARNDDMEQFFQALDEKINPCESSKAELLKKNLPSPAAKLRDDKNRTGIELLILPQNDSNSPKNFVKNTQKTEQQQQLVNNREQLPFLPKNLKLECNNVGKVDLMLVLDTSGSIYHSFPQQRQIALQILHAVEPALHSLQIGVIQFAHEPTVIHSLREPTVAKYYELLNRVRDLVFTGRNTRIADALELALNEFDEHGRNDAQKVIILISDGHGQEFWHRAAEVAHRLATTRDLQRFAVSSSLDYNMEELMLYMGDSKRIFVGQRSLIFMPTIIAFLNKCLPNSVKKIGTTQINLDENGIKIGFEATAGAVANSLETSTATAIDEFSTVANLSQMLGDTDNSESAANKNNSNNDIPPTSGGQAEVAPISNSNLTSSADDGQNVTGGQLTKLDKREKSENNRRILVDNERDEPIKAEDEDEKKDREESAKAEREQTLRKIVPEREKPSNVEEIECDTDVLIMLDRARPEQAFAQHVALAKHLVAKIEPEAIASGKTRVSIISFGNEATKDVGWDEKLPRRHILQKLDTIRQYNSATSFVQAAKTAIEEISKVRRPNAGLLATVFWSGLTGTDKANELANAMNQFNAINRTQLFVVSLNAKANLTRLKELAGDQWHVFVEGRASQFVGEASQHLLDCVLPPSGAQMHSSNNNDEPELLDTHEPLTSVERVEHLQAAARAFQKHPLGNCKDDLVDLAVLLHFHPQSGASTNEMSGQFQAMRRAAMATLRQASAEHYQKRIRLSLLINARVLVSLKTAIDLDDALFALDRAQLDPAELGGTVPLADKLQMSIDDLRQFHREGARVVILVLSNDEQQRLNADEHQSRRIIKGLDRLSASLFILHFAPRGAPPSAGPLSAQFNGSDTERTIRVFSTSGKISQFVDEFRRKTFTCRKHDGKLENPREEESFASDSTVAPSEDSKPITEQGTAESENESNTSSGGVKLLENVAELDSNNTSNTNEIASNVNLRAANMSDVPTTSEQIVSVPDASQNVSTENDEISLNNLTTVLPTEETVTVTTTVSTTTAAPTTTTITTTTATSTITTVAKQQTSRKPVKFAMSEDDHPHVFLLGDECKVDLMFIIDTSQSVQEAFEQQLQFAVDLVKRLPDQDFAQRVQVGAVSFNKKAQLQFTMGQLKEKPAILEALLHINHTGGGTSVVSGVNLAMDQVAKHRRKGTRLMVVLISDGTSQDPWADVIRSADRLRAAEADVYAVTVSHDYFFRELELYAGNKWFVYIDARIRQFLDEAEMSLVECKSPSVPSLSRDVRQDETNGTTLTALLPNMTTVTPQQTAATAAGGNCDKDPVDLMFIIDTSTSVQKEFYAEKNFALDLVRVLPEQDFSKRLSIAMVKFSGKADIHFHFHPGRTREDIIYDIERAEHTGGETSLATAAELAFREIFRLRRPEARLIVVIITDGNSQDEWKDVKAAAKKLRETTAGGNGVYAVTLSEKYSVEELREYTGSENNLYTNARIDQFIQEVGNSISRCPGGQRVGFVHVTPVPDVEASVTPTPFELNATITISPAKAKDGNSKKQNKEDEVAKARDEHPIRTSREDELFDETRGAEMLSKCKPSNMDLIIILDASTSRENVFEHQRELALSMIERLPINREDAHISTGIISFTNSPVLRQNLGLGRDRKTVRKAIEDIKYRGGSTLTSKAVELALQDMRRGMRLDARQVIVLMNDGMSQDPWEQVLESSRHLANSGAERFGVALGSEVDLRELQLYIGRMERIYRDGSTERFLRDIVSLVGVSSENCPPPSQQQQSTTFNNNAKINAVPVHRDQNAKRPSDLVERQQFEFQLDRDNSACAKPNVDLLIMFDNVISPERDNDNLKMNSNRYLLLDLLGSLPSDGRVRVALISAGGPRLEYRLVDPQDRDAVATRVERMRPLNGAPNYAAGIERALDHYASAGRDDARAILLIVGNGIGTVDSQTQRQTVEKRIKQTPALICMAVDSGKEGDIQTLVQYTGSPQNVFAFDRNAEFAKKLFDEVMASDQCQQIKQNEHVVMARAFNGNGMEKITKNDHLSKNRFINRQRQRDIGLIKFDKETFDNDKLVIKQSDQKNKDDSVSHLLSNLRHQDESIWAHYLNNTHFTEGTDPSTTIATTTTTTNSSIVTSHITRILNSASSHQPTIRTSLNTTTTPRIHVQKADKNDGVTISSSSPSTSTTTTATISEVPFRPGCLIDLMLIIDASGSIHDAFEQEKMLASQIVQQIRVGPDNARVAIVKFASAGKVRTVHAFDSVQDKQMVLDVIKNMTFSDGTTAIHSALQQATFVYSSLRGARPESAEPIAVVFTDGFGQHEFDEQASLLRRLIPRVYALAVHDGARAAPIARAELAKIAGDPSRVFTAITVANLHDELRERFRGC
ncbi:hypothetical protein niasHS_017337 [Heterodera schachtii]|uniref:VWFA domain-containing protein n=1 Tax=Heterodera schachtii TaxID=97005 RepID=A0ABD2HUX5_HETSC